MNARFAALVLLVALPACVSARDCATSIPEEFRADAIRLVLDRELCPTGTVPRDDLALGMGAGRPYALLDAERRKEVTLYATGYAACLNDRVDRGR